jgi:hypothetical protein
MIFIWCGISCSDYLDKTPDEDLTLEDVFQQRQYVERFLSATYAHISIEAWFSTFENGNWGRNPFVGASDEMEITAASAFCQSMNSGSWSPDNVGSAMLWSTIWEGVRKTNLFLENIHLTPMDESDKEIWIGEVKFLRAFYNFLGLRVHGPIPIIDRSYNADEDYSTIVRRPYDDCVNFVVKDCDDAAALLPPARNSQELGRPTSVAALALKARILLYQASPLFNGNPDYSNYVNAEGQKLFPDFDGNKWQLAADAARNCIDECDKNGYSLYYSVDMDPETSYRDLFLVRWNKEVLFARNIPFAYANNIESNMSPNGMGGISDYAPTQEMVDSYGMYGTNELPFHCDENGDPVYVSDNPSVNPASGYNDDLNMKWVGREPRFYASINYSGAQWRGRQLQFYSGGLDGKKTTGGYSKTGYLMRKMSSPDVDLVQQRFQLKGWTFFRVGEQYLNYAEALNEAGGDTPHPDVFKYVNMIRQRAGMPDFPGTLTKSEMRTRIRHERKIELAFETHRYFDCHRWKIAQYTDNRDIHGLNIDAGDNSFYTRRVVEKRVFTSPRHYLFPIPQDDMVRSQGGLIQSPRW